MCLVKDIANEAFNVKRKSPFVSHVLPAPPSPCEGKHWEPNFCSAVSSSHTHYCNLLSAPIQTQHLHWKAPWIDAMFSWAYGTSMNECEPCEIWSNQHRLLIEICWMWMKLQLGEHLFPLGSFFKRESFKGVIWSISSYNYKKKQCFF